MRLDLAMSLAQVKGHGHFAQILKNYHAKPARKILGMLSLLRDGHTIYYISRYNFDQSFSGNGILLIDGLPTEWNILEERGLTAEREERKRRSTEREERKNRMMGIVKE